MTTPASSAETLRTALIVAEDLPSWIAWSTAAATMLGVVLLVVEVGRAREARKAPVLFTGLLAAITMLLAVVRPQRLRAREVSIAPRVVVLLDRSRSMALSSTDRADDSPRIDVAEEVARTLRGRLGGRVDVFSFGSTGGDSVRTDPLDATTGGSDAPGPLARADGGTSDLGAALRALAERHEDPPAAIVVVSDGRVELGDLASAPRGPVVHGVAIGASSPPDAAIRAVHLAGAAVAHQALAVRVDVACTGGLSCGDLTVTLRELREANAASSEILASGTATVRDGAAVIELPVTLERAGIRAIEVSLAAPKGDAIPDNDRRLITVDVARERVRILHIAGRPTYDVRALRTWLKSDAAMDVVSFFILRTPGDDVGAPDEELALIPFPVRELFTEYLPTFDAIVFQDFDADPYGLSAHLPAIARYVEHGGGLVHVGGPNAFSMGGYAGTPLARVTPVEILKVDASDQGVDATSFVPIATAAGRAAPILGELEALVADDLPEFAGTSLLGDVRGGGVALWTHPRRTTRSGRPMPVLAIGEVGDGRSIALGLDSTRRLAFSPHAAKNAGRGYDALWRGLLGWLMRDPRYEPVRARLVHHDGAPPCLAGSRSSLRIEASPVVGDARLHATLSPLETPRAEAGEGLPQRVDQAIDGAPPILVPLATAPSGAWAVRLAVGERASSVIVDAALGALATRTLAVCERGGDEWADPRPDRAPLEALARANGGRVVSAADASSLPTPRATTVSIERNVAPILPAWLWGAIAATALGGHWFVRRRGGLA